MKDNNTDSSFKYTYSAKEQDEIKRIRQKYQTSEEDGMVRLRKLDAKVTQKATSVSLIFGVLGTLVFGIGISLVLSDLGILLGIPVMTSMVIGVIIGAIGIILAALAYPMYIKVIKKEREKVAPEILKLTEELMRM